MKYIPGYENKYSITTDGQVWSHKTNKFLKPGGTGKDRKYLGVSLNGKTQKVHRLVMKTYSSEYSDKLQVDHINENTFDNRLENLRMVDQVGNMFNREKPKGVSYNKVHNKYQARLQYNKQQMFLGWYDTEEEALAVRNKKKQELSHTK